MRRNDGSHATLSKSFFKVDAPWCSRPVVIVDSPRDARPQDAVLDLKAPDAKGREYAWCWHGARHVNLEWITARSRQKQLENAKLHDPIKGDNALQFRLVRCHSVGRGRRSLWDVEALPYDFIAI
jgi:hypothetical protein